MHEALARSPHGLDVIEQKALRVEDDAEYAYTTRKTVVISGKTVLLYERQRFDDAFCQLFIQVPRNDRDPDDVIEELGYWAPKEQYAVYLPAVMKALETVYWR